VQAEACFIFQEEPHAKAGEGDEKAEQAYQARGKGRGVSVVFFDAAGAPASA
jgi:hypothetical protein